MVKMEDNLSPYLTLVEQGSAPSNPASGNQKAYLRTSDHTLVTVNSSGTVTPVGGGGGGGGAMVLLEQHSASTSATLDFTTFISSTYDDYQIEFLNLVPATNNVDFWVRFSIDGGSTYDTGSSYSNSLTAFSKTATASAGSVTTAFTLRASSIIDSNSNGGVTGTMRLWYPGSTTTYRRARLDCSFLDGDPVLCTSICEYTGNAGSAINAVRFLFSSGNITSGIIRAYGIVKV